MISIKNNLKNITIDSKNIDINIDTGILQNEPLLEDLVLEKCIREWSWCAASSRDLNAGLLDRKQNQKISKGSHSRFVEGENEWLIKYLVFGIKLWFLTPRALSRGYALVANYPC